MYIPFNQLPSHARLWIYQANRPLTDAEQAEIKPLLERFATEWSSHGKGLQASAELLHNRFLVLANNETATAASGCSIDKSVNFVRELEQRFGVTFFDRTRLAFLQDGQVTLVGMSEVKEKVKAGEINKNTLYFDTLVDNYGELQEAWPRPAGTSWLSRYF
ncbi:hypothetical protein CLV24_112173 [Pontibacter ummariensis]|uniref:ABC transporter ATPase n=1 Tax=Pontibacter ummariensis TaxID=1610492 RepID=A0A239GTA3_9BACT|nr:hypothetical protein [Pontibacter ummariensis]PRY11044.1 hypothetical protein CLV24_112173 [Pontibacter ummariensis]SNS72072.1 hypothetical protein SAMN06296052_1125 [Pontibacter ummariensis]